MGTPYEPDPPLSESLIAAALTDLSVRLKVLLHERLEKLVLYGSRARGDYDPESDVDVAIIVKDLDRDLKLKIFDLVADIELEYLVPLSTLVLSYSAFTDLLTRERLIALDIEGEGIPL
ncbi:MAG: nucleotidyltransferase domain-containing protein [Spirochaetota bacterium]